MIHANERGLEQNKKDDQMDGDCGDAAADQTDVVVFQRADLVENELCAIRNDIQCDEDDEAVIEKSLRCQINVDVP